MLLILTEMLPFGEIHVFGQLRQGGLLGPNRAYLHLETSNLQEVFHKKLTQLSRETIL